MERRTYFKRNVSTLEPFLESLPQLIIKACVWTFFSQMHLESIQRENPLFDGTTANFFYFTFGVSALSSVLGIIRFFKDGPARFLPQTGPVDGFLTFTFILTFFSVFLHLTSKVLLCTLMMFNALGVIQVIFPEQPPGIIIVGTASKPLCNNLTLVNACDDGSFQVRPQIPDPNNHTLKWASEEWRVFIREPGPTFNGVHVFWDADQSRWTEGFDACLTDSCKCSGDISNNCGTLSRMYCSDNVSIVTWSRLVTFAIWALLNVIPQFVLAVSVLFIASITGFVKSSLHFPELLMSPCVANIVFAPQNDGWKCKPKTAVKIRMNKLLSWVNVFISVIGQLASLLILFFHFRNISPNNLTFANFLSHGSTTIHSDNKSDFIPPYSALICLVISIILLTVLFYHEHIVCLLVCTCASSVCTCISSEHPFLAPLECQAVQITSNGLSMCDTDIPEVALGDMEMKDIDSQLKDNVESTQNEVTHAKEDDEDQRHNECMESPKLSSNGDPHITEPELSILVTKKKQWT